MSKSNFEVDSVSETGVWLDQSGKLSTSPVTGVQIVAPGRTITRATKAVIDAATEAEPKKAPAKKVTERADAPKAAEKRG